MRAIRRFSVRPVLPEPLTGLGTLVNNLRWAWHPETQDVFEAVDPQLWRSTGGDPVRLLGEVPAARLDELANDQAFLRRLELAVTDLHGYVSDDRWFQAAAGSPVASVAYFSPEFGITHVLPQYSGGLGILAGDHLKAASDLGVPLIGVGLLYRHGYFGQSLNREGWQQERYPLVDPDGLPISLLRDGPDPGAAPATVSVTLPEGRQLHAQIWVAQVGRVPLLMLDSDMEENEPAEREVTDRLYGGNTEHRLLQELLLGVGGVRAVRTFCRVTGHPSPEVFHTNEGHAGFLGIERIRELATEQQLDFDTALEVARGGTVFTTHTPVPAGIDRFPVELIQQHFSPDAFGDGVPVDRILALGAEDFEGGDPGVFNMAIMGLRLAQRANGVSKLHGVVSRGMFAGLWPSFDATDVPITSITNGVHAPTWVAREISALTYANADQGDSEDMFEGLDKTTDAQLWETKRILRQRFIDDTRSRVRASWINRGASDAELGWVDSILDPDVLTMGFARRVPSYKRLTLMLRDTDRLKRLLLHPTRPVQIVIAGKAHPADEGGKKLIQEMVRFADDPELRHRIVFVPDYDIALAQPMYPGCDVWLNNPLRPYEACGTSGMKAALNGALNLSIRDGWWDEWYDDEFGWAIPSAEGIEDTDRRDDLEAHALYDLIEKQVAPRFYDGEVPGRWIEMLRHTIKELGPKVLATRMVRDYVEQLYVPAAQSSRHLNSTYDGARALAAWKKKVRAAWPQIRVDHVELQGLGDVPQLGTTVGIRAFVSLGDLTPSDIDVEALHGRVDSTDEITDAVRVSLSLAETYEGNRHRFEGELKLDRTGAFGYTVRVLPKNAMLASPAELGLAAGPSDPDDPDTPDLPAGSEF
ncbi:alpha-glucan phosphorylase [Kribbella flavida DSM 17836]|uniref:glycogen phosphorylase n=1 Tax=Kribbella flavida (strain DSM 17836 / JCM 10339 / NBRC 14399) TaxID=479435 RepID=D2Q210_KRIFD|nr:alpha-glucan family phosphorylase [Kribbella flavida]ADB33956.1 alpha-glucan phosphorylase [Kribbella flavida DSM 17836]